MSNHPHNFPKLHNAAWPGVVGKGPDSEPPIDLDTMLDLTAAAEVDGQKFDGFDLFLFAPHVDIDSSDDDLKVLADKARKRKLVIGSVVAPVWPPTGGGSAMGSDEDRQKFLTQVKKGCRIASKLRELGIRPYGVVRIDSACGVGDWRWAIPTPTAAASPTRFARPARSRKISASSFRPREKSAGARMHSWRRMVQLLQLVGRPQTLGFQADMAHTLLYVMGYNAPEDAILPQDFDWKDKAKLEAAIKQVVSALRPWTNDFHIAQNDATVHGTGSHDKTGRHCLPKDPNGKLDIVKVAGYWLRDDRGELLRRCRHVCWDGCMFPNSTMMNAQTWRDILGAMVAVRDAHGWKE